MRQPLPTDAVRYGQSFDCATGSIAWVAPTLVFMSATGRQPRAGEPEAWRTYIPWAAPAAARDVFVHLNHCRRGAPGEKPPTLPRIPALAPLLGGRQISNGVFAPAAGAGFDARLECAGLTMSNPASIAPPVFGEQRPNRSANPGKSRCCIGTRIGREFGKLAEFLLKNAAITRETSSPGT